MSYTLLFIHIHIQETSRSSVRGPECSLCEAGSTRDAGSGTWGTLGLGSIRGLGFRSVQGLGFRVRGWLSKVPYYIRDPKMDHNFDNHPRGLGFRSVQVSGFRLLGSYLCSGIYVVLRLRSFRDLQLLPELSEHEELEVEVPFPSDPQCDLREINTKSYSFHSGLYIRS